MCRKCLCAKWLMRKRGNMSKIEITKTDSSSIYGTKIFADGVEIKRVRKIDFSHEAGCVPIAKMELATYGSEISVDGADCIVEIDIGYLVEQLKILESVDCNIQNNQFHVDMFELGKNQGKIELIKQIIGEKI